MAKCHWRELFPSHIWQRGRNYYQDGHILGIRRYGNHITAEVEGTDIYTVSVTLDTESNRIEDFSCDCPYGEDGTPCKHLAALLYALEKDAVEKNSKENDEPVVAQVVNLLSREQMQQLLIQLAQNDFFRLEKNSAHGHQPASANPKTDMETRLTGTNGRCRRLPWVYRL